MLRTTLIFDVCIIYDNSGDKSYTDSAKKSLFNGGQQSLVFSLFTGLMCGSIISGLPQSGKNIWKMKFFPGQGILWMVREI